MLGIVLIEIQGLLLVESGHVVLCEPEYCWSAWFDDQFEFEESKHNKYTTDCIQLFRECDRHILL